LATDAELIDIRWFSEKEPDELRERRNSGAAAVPDVVAARWNVDDENGAFSFDDDEVEPRRSIEVSDADDVESLRPCEALGGGFDGVDDPVDAVGAR